MIGPKIGSKSAANLSKVDPKTGLKINPEVAHNQTQNWLRIGPQISPKSAWKHPQNQLKINEIIIVIVIVHKEWIATLQQKVSSNPASSSTEPMQQRVYN
jgi:hypothetical protein